MKKKLSDAIPSILALSTEVDVMQFSADLAGISDNAKNKVRMAREAASILISKVDSMEKALALAIVSSMKDELLVEGLKAMEIVQQTDTRLVATSLLEKDKEKDARGFVIVEKLVDNVFSVRMF